MRLDQLKTQYSLHMSSRGDSRGCLLSVVKTLGLNLVAPQVKPSAAINWQQTTIANLGNGCTFAEDDLITIDFKLTANTSAHNYVKLGELQYGYN
jgi:hypothetical protein